MHSSWVLWLLMVLKFSSSSSFSDYPLIKLVPKKMAEVNHTVNISCTIESNTMISLYQNGTLLLTKGKEIKYSFRSDKPGLYKFSCKSPGKEPTWALITYRYKPRVRSVTPLITGLNSCHMVVKFEVDHFMTKDNIRIDRSDDDGKSFKDCSEGQFSCEFQCRLFKRYVLKVLISTFLEGEVEPFLTTINASSEFYKLDEMNVTVSAKGSESINLTYGIRNNITELQNKEKFPQCLYRIFYKSQWDQTQKNITTSKTEIQLENLMPYTMYTINVQAKLNGSLYWSDNVTLTERTLSAAPYTGPNSTNGSFLEIPCADKPKRCFILYWATIPMPLRNGILDRYIIQQDNRTLLYTSELYAQINDQPQNKDLWFEIRAQNEDFQLSPPTVIHIPPKAPERPKGVSVVSLNDTLVSISWVLEQSMKNVTVTVMSCLGEKTSYSSRCKSDVTWTQIQNKNFTILNTKGATNYLAAAYVSNSEGSSSLTFADCILSGGISNKPQIPKIGMRYPHQIDLRWPVFSCGDLFGRPTVFQILYAERNSCRNGLKMNIPAIGTKPETENISIKNLKPFTKYLICLRIHTEQGWSQESSQVETSTAETNPSSSVVNLEVVDTTSSSVTLRWNSTLQPNGFITHHFVYYDKHKTFSNASNMATVSELDSNSKYNFAVSTCNKAGCSEKSSYITATTSNQNKNLKMVVIGVMFSIMALLFILCCCGILSRRLYKSLKKVDVDIEYPDENEDEPSSNSQTYLIGCDNGEEKLDNTKSICSKETTAKIQDNATLDPESQTKLINGKSEGFRNTGEEEIVNLNINDRSSRKSLESVYLDESEKSTDMHKNHNRKEEEVIIKRKKSSPISNKVNLDPNGYVKSEDISLSELSLDISDSKLHGNNGITSCESSLNYSHSYVRHEMKYDNSDTSEQITSSGSLQLDSNGYAQSIFT